MSWFAVRSVYAHQDGESENTWFLERHVLFRASSHEELLEFAEQESARYLKLNPPARRLGELTVLELAENIRDFHGAEVWSMVRESRSDPELFYLQHYSSLDPTGEG